MKTWQINVVLQTSDGISKYEVEGIIRSWVSQILNFEKVLDVEASDLSKPKPVIASGGH